MSWKSRIMYLVFGFTVLIGSVITTRAFDNAPEPTPVTYPTLSVSPMVDRFSFSHIVLDGLAMPVLWCHVANEPDNVWTFCLNTGSISPTRWVFDASVHTATHYVWFDYRTGAWVQEFYCQTDEMDVYEFRVCEPLEVIE